MDVGLSPVHGRELLSDTLEKGLDGRAVADEGRRHLEATGRDVALGGRDVSGDPLDEVSRVLDLDGLELVLDLPHRYLSSEDAADGEVSAVSRVRGRHHVLGVEHLLRELGDGDGAVRGGATSRERREADHEEVESREGHHVDGELSQVRVELTRESETRRHTRHDNRDEVVQVSVRRRRELEGSEADVVERLVVDTEGRVRVLNELVDRERRVVRLDNGVGHLRVRSYNTTAALDAPWARGRPRRCTSFGPGTPP